MRKAYCKRQQGLFDQLAFCPFQTEKAKHIKYLINLTNGRYCDIIFVEKSIFEEDLCNYESI